MKERTFNRLLNHESQKTRSDATFLRQLFTGLALSFSYPLPLPLLQIFLLMIIYGWFTWEKLIQLYGACS